MTRRRPAPDEHDPDQLLSTFQVSQLLQCGEETVRRLYDRGELTASDFGVPGHPRLRFTRREVRALIARRQLPAPAKRTA